MLHVSSKLAAKMFQSCVDNSQGRTLACPFVGMARKQDGGYNGCVSNYTMITRLGPSAMHFEALFTLLSAALANETAKIVCQQH